jgi:aminoglycoside N3'-acetyltransferase
MFGDFVTADNIGSSASSFILPGFHQSMPIPAFSRDELFTHLSGLGLRKGMHVAVHSRLISFGRIEGGAEAVFSVLREIVGSEGTLVFPTYTLSLDDQAPYSPLETPSQGMGALAELARKHPDSQRTLSPMHSHVSIGARTEEIMSANSLRSLGEGSAFAAMEGADFSLLLLGCSFHEGATFIHHVEAVIGVPYREWIDLPRLVKKPDGSTHGVSCQYYARRESETLDTDLSGVEHRIRKERIGKSKDINSRVSYLVKLSELHRCIEQMLAESPYSLMLEPDSPTNAPL